MTRPLYLDPDLAFALRCAASGDHSGDTDAGSAPSYVTLGGSEGRHAATVRRTAPGEQVDISNGAGLRVTIEVDEVTKTEIGGRVLGVVQEEPTVPRIVVVQALAKGGRDEQAIETCTEFGADAFIPWMSERTIVRWKDAKRARSGREKLAATAWAAAKQSRRAYLPQVEQVVTTAQLAERVAEFSGTVFVCHEEADNTLVDALDYLESGEPSEQIMVIVGPEGGISPTEVDTLKQAGAEVVLLGRHVLRSATAGGWACAVIRAKLG